MKKVDKQVMVPEQEAEKIFPETVHDSATQINEKVEKSKPVLSDIKVDDLEWKEKPSLKITYEIYSRPKHIQIIK